MSTYSLNHDNGTRIWYLFDTWSFRFHVSGYKFRNLKPETCNSSVSNLNPPHRKPPIKDSAVVIYNRQGPVDCFIPQADIHAVDAGSDAGKRHLLRIVDP